MSELNNYEDVMVEETEMDNFESVEGRDLSTMIGVGLIAGAGVVVYEGGKRGIKLLKTKVIDPLREKRAAKKVNESTERGQKSSETEDGNDADSKDVK